ncbi:MAG TPA: transcription-repair coupling factor [Oligoflexia bacterium]|nr:transcription-repair coupling factor [Oligoflexia bacterium]HMP27699.1 transcription-repair coupling factor [Oligoflexia bacterium]
MNCCLRLESFPEELLEKRGRGVNIVGVDSSASKACFLSLCFRNFKRIFFISSDQNEIEKIKNDLNFFLGADKVFTFPPRDVLPFSGLSVHAEVSAERIATLLAVASGKEGVFLANSNALFDKLPKADDLKKISLNLSSKNLSTLSKEALASKLRLAGFKEISLVRDVGDMAIRGEVIDLFPARSKFPIRIRFAENAPLISSFDPDSQLSLGVVEEVAITPTAEYLPFVPNLVDLQLANDRLKKRADQIGYSPSRFSFLLSELEKHGSIAGFEEIYQIFAENSSSLLEVLKEAQVGGDPSNFLIIIDHPALVKAAISEFEDDLNRRHLQAVEDGRLIPSLEKSYLNGREVDRLLFSADDAIYLGSDFETAGDRQKLNWEISDHVALKQKIKSASTAGHRAYQPLAEAINKFLESGFLVVFTAATAERELSIAALLKELSFDCKIRSNLGDVFAESFGERKKTPFIVRGDLSQGFAFSLVRLAVFCESDIFGGKRKSLKQAKPVNLRKILSFISRLAAGDLVVHQDYGIGRYLGIKNIEIEGASTDFLEIQYADSKLYLPAVNISKISRYGGASEKDDIVPLDRLASSRWQKAKSKARATALLWAGELINLYAARAVGIGRQFPPWGEVDEEFARTFPYQETPDQEQAIFETIADMAKARPMDRLICGDVGFGKTEVAVRAAFKALQDGKQVAFLAPTTILVEQHLKVFCERFADYPVEIAALSRFYSKAEQREVLARLASGKIDIVIGTHRLIQADISFKDLGLLIIDEEHRFGVKQKERLKRYKRSVDVLSLTATPIPRSLQISLCEIRDISLINTPPSDRKAIKTFIAQYSDSIVRDAIIREVRRSGQVFFVHNRIDELPLIIDKLSALVPEASFRYAHGQMPEVELEMIMQDFIDKKFDCLVSTTIIESGLDIPNANTIIINRADAFGMAQLYQMRGRVGRSAREAFAYLLIPPTGVLKGDAHRRLAFFDGLEDLGVGFNLALRDLEIRGAGNLLGKEQSGHIAEIGFELYTKILHEAIANLKGERLPIEEMIDPEIKGEITAYIPEDYLPDISERLTLYQRLAMAPSEVEIEELRSEMIDRYGRLPEETSCLLELSKIKATARKLAALSVEIRPTSLTLKIAPEGYAKAEEIFRLAQQSLDRKTIFKKPASLILQFEDLKLDACGLRFVGQILAQLCF